MTDSEKLELILSEMCGMKTDMQGMKTDMQGMKSDIQGMKSDIQGMKSDMQGITVDIHNMKTDIKDLKKQGSDTFDELMRVERIALENQDSIKELNGKYNALFLKADNSDLLLRLINQQAEEVTRLKAMVE